MKKNPAFSMIELVFVIVVVGILASTSLSQMDRDIQQEAISTTLSNLRLTQQTALSDSKHNNSNQQWQRSYWQFRYQKCGNNDYRYSITSDSNYDGVNDRNESLISSLDSKYIFFDCNNDNEEDSKQSTFNKYGISSIMGRGDDCSALLTEEAGSIAFDNLGRPHYNVADYSAPNFSEIAKIDCSIIFEFENSNYSEFVINIENTTGFISVEGRENL